MRPPTCEAPTGLVTTPSPTGCPTSAAAPPTPASAPFGTATALPSTPAPSPSPWTWPADRPLFPRPGRSRAGAPHPLEVPMNVPTDVPTLRRLVALEYDLAVAVCQDGEL